MFNFEGGPEGIVINREVQDKLKFEVAVIVASAIKDRLVRQVVDSLSPKNFLGEALDYLRDHSMVDTAQSRLQCATLILEEFKQDIDSLVYLDETGKIVVNQSIADFEFGSYYKPAMKIITKTLEISSNENMK